MPPELLNVKSPAQICVLFVESVTGEPLLFAIWPPLIVRVPVPIAELVPPDPELWISKLPAERMVPPLYVFAPESERPAPPVWLRLPGPLITPARVAAVEDW